MARALLDFLPLYPNEDEDTIRLRWDEWANEGTDPVLEPDEWVDVREGAFFFVNTQPGVQEAARTYDFMGTEVVAAAFPATAWGEYLDRHGETYGVERSAAVPSEGFVTFYGVAETFVGAGTRVSAPAISPEDDPPVFEVTQSGTIPGVAPALGVIELPVIATTSGRFANVSAGAITQLESNVPGIDSVSNTERTVGGSNPQTDTEFRLKILGRFQESASANKATYESWGLAEPGVGRVTVIPEGAGPGTVLVIILTSDGQPVSESVKDSLQLRLDPSAATAELTADVTLPAAVLTVDSTEGFRDVGFIRVNDELVRYTGLTATTFTGCSGGTGLQEDGSAVNQGGRGGGLAPIGHHVAVSTATTDPVTISATVEMEPGYTLDGTGGTIGNRADIEDSLADYVNAIIPGGELVIAKVIGAFTNTVGVHDVGDLLVNGAAVNITFDSDPAVVPDLTLPATLTEGTL